MQGVWNCTPITLFWLCVQTSLIFMLHRSWLHLQYGTIELKLTHHKNLLRSGKQLCYKTHNHAVKCNCMDMCLYCVLHANVLQFTYNCVLWSVCMLHTYVSTYTCTLQDKCKMHSSTHVMRCEKAAQKCRVLSGGGDQVCFHPQIKIMVIT